MARCRRRADKQYYTNSKKQLSGLIETLKTTPWQPEHQSPFRLVIVETEQEKFVFIVNHPIIENQLSDFNVINCLKSNYDLLNKDSLVSSLVFQEVDLSEFNFHSGSNDNIKDIILTEFRTSLDDSSIELDDDFLKSVDILCWPRELSVT